MSKETDEHLLKKYRIPQMGDYSQPGSVLCDILQRLDTNKKLGETDKKWIRDKGMFKFYKFLENWESTGKPNFNDIHSSVQNSSYSGRGYTRDSVRSGRHISHLANVQKNDKRSRPNSVPAEKKEKNTIGIAAGMRKSHMPLQYKKSRLAEHIKSNIEEITPSNIPENISSMFLPKIWDTINESIKKDINELFRAYSHNLWTATSLMAYRIFENVLKVHIEYDLKDEPAKDITDAINKLEKHEYNSFLLDTLRKFKDHRNSFMHGNIRASPQEAKKSIIDVMSLAMNIHNIKP